MLNNNLYVCFSRKIFAEKKYIYYLCKRKQETITLITTALDNTVKSKIMKKVFKSINLDIEEVAEFIENNGLSFMCNEEMNVEASEEDFNKLIDRYPEIDYVEL